MGVWVQIRARLWLVGGMLLLFLLGGWAVPPDRAETATHKVPTAGETRRLSDGATAFYLAEMVQREDSVVYRTDPKDGDYQQRQREERDKEKKSWNMLNNLIIDGRQGPRPPRRFSDTPVNDSLK